MLSPNPIPFKFNPFSEKDTKGFVRSSNLSLLIPFF